MKSIAVICGGKSPEHEISVRSAKNILAAINREKFTITLIGIDRKGCWRLLEEDQLDKFVPESGPQLALVPGNSTGQIIRLDTLTAIDQPDAIFGILHGPLGEDGTFQGLLRILDIPFVGPDVLGSAISMDKDVTKRLLRAAGINVARGMVVKVEEKDFLSYGNIVAQFGKPLFIKPANMGSSVGVHKVESSAAFYEAIDDAFQYDTKVLIEEMIIGREVECAILGNAFPEASNIGEIVISSKEEYSFDAKYENPDAAKIIIPAEIHPEELEELKNVALLAYTTLCCEVLSRVDMFLTPAGDVYVNEINTLPGFTNISMYPKLWQHAGISYPDLITRLIEFSIERYETKKRLKTNWRAD